jgi:molybdopterin converting factor small subunit
MLDRPINSSYFCCVPIQSTMIWVDANFLAKLREELGKRESRMERDKAICSTLEQLIQLLEGEGGAPVSNSVSNSMIEAWKSSSHHLANFAAVIGKKTLIPRQADFVSMSVLDAARSLLRKHGILHADKLVEGIFIVDKTNFQRAKSMVVSELVKAMKKNEFRRVGPNLFALPEGTNNREVQVTS